MTLSANIFLIPEKVIIKTDICLNVNDMDALAIGQATGNQGETKILAVASSAHFEMAVTAAESSRASL